MADQLTKSELERQREETKSSTKHTGWKDPDYNSDQLSGFSGIEPGDGIDWCQEWSECRRRISDLNVQEGLSELEKETKRRLKRRANKIAATYLGSQNE